MFSLTFFKQIFNQGEKRTCQDADWFGVVPGVKDHDIVVSRSSSKLVGGAGAEPHGADIGTHINFCDAVLLVHGPHLAHKAF